MQNDLFEDSRPIFKVSEVTKDIKKFLEDSFSQVWISGEVSNFKASAAGHTYFTLKDEQAQMRIVMFRGAASKLKFKIEDGIELVVHGNISVYEARGDYQLLADHAEPKGIGALQLAFEQLKMKLSHEGIFDSDKKRTIPLLPRKVGIITSSQGAVWHDMQTVIRRRFPLMDLVLAPVKVQGEGSVAEIVRAIELLNTRDDVDVLLVGRGGGSLEDLWSFNTEEVVRAIAASRIPIISAVGHETDVTLADFAADMRAPTPSAAAELAVPIFNELADKMSARRRSLEQKIQKNIIDLKTKIEWISQRFATPKNYLNDQILKIDDYRTRFILALERFLTDCSHKIEWIKKGLVLPDAAVQKHLSRLEYASIKLQSLIKNKLLIDQNRFYSLQAQWPDVKKDLTHMQLKLDSLKQKLIAYSPQEVLKKGYAVILSENNSKVCKSVLDFKTGDSFIVKMQDGELKAIVI